MIRSYPRAVRPLVLIAAALMCLGVVSACSSGDGGGGGGGKDVRVGIVGYSAADATLNKTAELMVAGAKKRGWTADYQAATPAGDAAKANELMQVMLGKGADLIITIAFDPDNLAAGIARAQRENVPVMAMSAGKTREGVAWASNVGYLPAMGTQIEKDFAKASKVEVLNLTYLLATPGQGRNQLIKKVAKDNPKFSLTDKEVQIPGAVQSGRDFTAAWLSAHPPRPGVSLAIYAVFDQPAEGAVAALKQAGRRDVKIYSYDATPAGLALVKQGYVVANVQNGRAAQATQAMAAADQVIAGKLTVENPKVVPAAAFIVTTENVKQFEKEHPKAFTSEGE